MAQQTCNAIEYLDKQGRGLRVEFQKKGDRFGHAIFSIHGHSTDAPDADNPDADDPGADAPNANDPDARGSVERPLLTTVEGTPDDFSPPSPPFAELHQQQDASFLSGATSLGLWSMSVEVRDDKICFDVACRAHAEVNNLGSTYRVLGTDYTLESNQATVSKISRDSLHLGPKPSISKDFPQTIQWSFALGFSDAGFSDASNQR